MIPTVSVVRCASYNEGEVAVSVSKALSLIGGIGKFVKKGDRVLLKPNLLMPSTPDRAVTLKTKWGGITQVLGKR